MSGGELLESPNRSGLWEMVRGAMSQVVEVKVVVPQLPWMDSYTVVRVERHTQRWAAPGDFCGAKWRYLGPIDAESQEGAA